jgi:hypothetical protein
MDPDAPTGAHRRGLRRWAKWLCALVATPILLFALSNLWLASPWGTAFLTKRIGLRLGLETHLSSASWSPWNGVTLHGLTCHQPAPLRAAIRDPFLTVSSIRISPVWRAWLRGRIAIHQLEVDTPQITLPVELLAHLSASAPPAPAPQPPPTTNPVNPPTAPPTTPPPADPTPQPAPPPSPTTPTQPARPTSWLHLKNATLTLVSASRETPWFESGTLTGSIPIAGGNAKNQLHLGPSRALGQPLTESLNIPVTWQSPALTLGPIAPTILGLKSEAFLQIALTSGLPIHIEALLPPQTPPTLTLPNNSPASAKSITAHARLRGLLLAPTTLQGDFLAQTADAQITLNENTLHFHRGNLLTVLRNGHLQCVDARLIGDDLALLGNAAILSDQRTAAALRIVADPGNLIHLTQRLLPGLTTPPPLTPLSTPQRAALDTRLFGKIGNLGQLTLEIGHQGPQLTLPQALATPSPP